MTDSIDKITPLRRGGAYGSTLIPSPSADVEYVSSLAINDTIESLSNCDISSTSVGLHEAEKIASIDVSTDDCDEVDSSELVRIHPSNNDNSVYHYPSENAAPPKKLMLVVQKSNQPRSNQPLRLNVYNQNYSMNNNYQYNQNYSMNNNYQYNQMKQIMPNHELSFHIIFPYADIFSNLIRFLYGSHGKLASDKNYFELSPQYLEYKGIDCSKSVLNHCVIDMENTSHHTMSPPEKTKLFLPLKSLSDLTSNYRKDMAVTLYKKAGENLIFITPGSGSNNSADTFRSNKILCLEQLNLGMQEEIDVEESEYEFDFPNAVITATELKDMCKALKGRKDVHISGSAGSIAFVFSESGSGTVSRGWQFHSNNPNMKNSTEILRGYVDGAIIKNLSHLEKLAPTGLIKVYIQGPTRIKLVAPIGYIGKQYTYISLASS